MINENTGGAFFTGFLVGIVGGAVAVLLTTPQSGADTRHLVQSKGSALKTQVGDMTSGVQERGKVIIQERLPAADKPGSPLDVEPSMEPGDAGSVDDSVDGKAT